MAQKLIKFNMIEFGAQILEKINQSKKAVDVCVLHNYWSSAVEIAHRNNFAQIDNLV